MLVYFELNSGTIWDEDDLTFRNVTLPVCNGLFTFILALAIFQVWRSKTDQNQVCGSDGVVDKINHALALAQSSRVLVGNDFMTVAEIISQAATESEKQNHARVEQLVDHMLASDQFPQNVQVLFVGSKASCALKQGEAARAYGIVNQWIAKCNDPALSIYLLDWINCKPFMEDQWEFLHYADLLASKALAIQPNKLTLMGTKASLLTELGKYDEAYPLLLHVYQKSESAMDRGICTFYLSLIENKRGNHQVAGKYAAEARANYSGDWMLKRLPAVEA